MSMKSILAIACLVSMVLANPTNYQKEFKRRVNGLICEMNTTCASLKTWNYSNNLIKKLNFEDNCNKSVYQKTLCQVNGALKQLNLVLDSKIHFSKFLLGDYYFLKDNCTLPEKSITVTNFCSDVQNYLQWLYNTCPSKI